MNSYAVLSLQPTQKALRNQPPQAPNVDLWLGRLHYDILLRNRFFYGQSPLEYHRL